jgi:excisionase family DNA binding protein
MNDATYPLALRPRDAARLLGISPRTLWGWTRAGLIPHVRVGVGGRRLILYPTSELKAWLAQHATTGGEGQRIAPTNGVHEEMS